MQELHMLNMPRLTLRQSYTYDCYEIGSCRGDKPSDWYWILDLACRWSENLVTGSFTFLFVPGQVLGMGDEEYYARLLSRKSRQAYASPSFRFLANSLPALIRSSIPSLSLSSFNLVIMHFEGAMPMGTDWPLDFSRETRSMWTTYLRR